MADRAGFEAYFRQYLGRVTRACALVLADRSGAEEVAAEAFTRLWANWDRIAGEEHASGYVFKTAMRLCVRRARTARQERDLRPPRVEATDDAVRSLVRMEVFAALGELPVRQRQVVVLRDWAGFPTAHVAEVLGLRESTVRVHLARGRQALRGLLTIEERET
jgi:RNA polymerase sigma-70 factor, ECF subfamily